MKILTNAPRDMWREICRRNKAEDDQNLQLAVSEIIDNVRNFGDKALIDYSLKFDGVKLDNIVLSQDKINQLADTVSQSVSQAIDRAGRNIEAFHSAQLMKPLVIETVPGVRCMQRQVPITSVGLYIPGGRAPLFSTVLMLAIPAKLAGCQTIVLCTPPDQNGLIAPEIAYTARACGVDRICLTGGAQAIAAMAYGTESIPPVNKIFGPGNRYVTKAKQMVAPVVSIDMPAGPSEVMVMADASANIEYVAADLLSQAEHGPDSQAMLVCNSVDIANRVVEAVERQRLKLTRNDCIEHSLSESRILVFDSRDDMVEFANCYAPEHLIISMSRPWDIADRITAAGSVFIGNYSPESAGDYASGTNHTLPTSGWASSCSGVNIDSFMKKITYQEITVDGLTRLAPIITNMAEAEGLDAHANAVRVRLS